MGRYVLVVDTSGSMYCYMTELKKYLKTFIDGLTAMGQSSQNQIALVSFANNVDILHHYTHNPAPLKALVDGLTAGGMTAMEDGILVGLVCEYERPDELFVFSDDGENSSNAKEADWNEIANRYKAANPSFSVNLVTPSEGTYQADCFRFARFFTAKPISIKMAVTSANAIAKRVKTARVISTAEDLLRLKPEAVHPAKQA